MLDFLIKFPLQWKKSCHDFWGKDVSHLSGWEWGPRRKEYLRGVQTCKEIESRGNFKAVVLVCWWHDNELLSGTSPSRQPPKGLHCQNHLPRTKSNDQFYLKQRQLPFSSSVDRTSSPGLHWVAARMLPVVEENATTASEASRMTHRPWCPQGRPKKWRKRISLFTRAHMDRRRPTYILTKSWLDVHDKVKKKWKVSHPKCFLITSEGYKQSFPSSVTRTALTGLTWWNTLGEIRENTEFLRAEI